MPARSNLFQRLVLEIHRDLGADWDVQECRSLLDSITGSLREVDIVAEGSPGGYRMIIAVEVRDRMRAADVTSVESLAKKHEHLPTSKLVLWSSSGFTKDAIEKAKALNIEVITPRAPENAPWATLAKRLVAATAQLVWSDVKSCTDVRLRDGSLARWEAPCKWSLLARMAR